MNPDTLAQALVDAHRSGVRTAPSAPGLSRPDILSIQSRVSEALGPVAGFKVGAGPGEAPILAPIPAIYETKDGGSRTVRDRIGIELEVGFTLMRALPPGGLPARPQDHFRPRAVLEIVDTRLSGAPAEDPALKFADLQINAGLVLGEGPADWDGSDFGTVTARLKAGGTPVLDGQATVPGGSALANLDLLLRHLGDHCGGLQVGQTVITGSLCGLPWFEAGVTVEGRIEGLGAVSVSLI